MNACSLSRASDDRLISAAVDEPAIARYPPLYALKAFKATPGACLRPPERVGVNAGRLWRLVDGRYSNSANPGLLGKKRGEVLLEREQFAGLDLFLFRDGLSRLVFELHF